jgi:hypothetical protein
VTTILIGALSIGVVFLLDSIKQAMVLVITASAGVGSVLIMRWYWWRISAYSEIAAVLTPMCLAVVNGVLQAGGIHEPLLEDFPENLYFYVSFTTIVWVLVTYTTKPTSDAKLDAFYVKVKPRGRGWDPVARRCPSTKVEIQKGPSIMHSLIDWLTGVIFIYSTLFGIGNCLLGSWISGALLLFIVTPLTAFRIWWSLERKNHFTRWIKTCAVCSPACWESYWLNVSKSLATLCACICCANGRSDDCCTNVNQSFMNCGEQFAKVSAQSANLSNVLRFLLPNVSSPAKLSFLRGIPLKSFLLIIIPLKSFLSSLSTQF